MKYFSIKELSATSTGLKNVPNKEQEENLVALIEVVLDPAREELGEPIIVTSGFRSDKVNSAVGGSKTSQHMTGQAVDLVTKNNRSNAVLFSILKTLPYDQLIWEFGDDKCPAWCHVSYRKDGENRHQILRAVKQKGKTVYIKMS